MAYGTTSLTAAGSLIVRMVDQPNNQDNVAEVEVSGTYVTAVAATQSTLDTTTSSSLFANIQCTRIDTGVVENTPTMTNGTTRKWLCNIAGASQFKLNLSSLGSGTFTATVNTYFTPGGLGQILNQQNSSNIANTVTSTSANALAVGRQGATNPVLNVDASATTVATGVTIVGAAAGSGVEIQATTSGTNEVLLIDAAAAALVKIGTVASTATGLQVGSSTSAANATLIVQSSNAAALTVGRQGATTPALKIDASTATSTTGISIKSAANTSGVAVAAIGGNGNENTTIDAVGSGVMFMASVSTGGCNVRVPVTTAAATGTTIANVNTTLKEGFNYITAANNALAVILPVGAVGMQVTVVNAVYTATLPVFPQVNAAINNLAANASYSIGNGAKRTFTFATTNLWYSDLVTIS